MTQLIFKLTSKSLDLFEGKNRSEKVKDFLGINILCALALNGLTQQSPDQLESERSLIQKAPPMTQMQ